ncbi:MAG: hypothetical protein U9R36_06055 [Elusimicrobiota bacterium]|nr:hypothetical protein [Elusimicrobiota bacterium]
MGRTYLSEEGYEKLQEELQTLISKKQKIVKRVKVAADHGDLKENFE